jgi:hypothetical protein
MAQVVEPLLCKAFGSVLNTTKRKQKIKKKPNHISFTTVRLYDV